ncbi:MAG TPA: hypothetical protein VGQ76_05390 [Thermoanaerobaculia bacterium]|jgi:hypothetical protein|nr:hypothetical protein [Thermoanaerobaculia bacterium]
MRKLSLLPFVLTLAVSAHATLVPFSEKRVTAPTPDVAAFNQAWGRIATDGDAFLAVWIEYDQSGSGDVHGALVSPEGERSGDDVLRIATTAAREERVEVAFGGGRYLVAWLTPTKLLARFVGRDGAMSSVIEIGSATISGKIGLAFNGSRFLVTWEYGGHHHGALISTTGEIVKTFDVGVSSATAIDTPLVAANGGFHFLTSVTDFNGVPNVNGFPSDVGVTSIDENGTVGARVVVMPAVTPVFDLNATSSGTEILAGWTTAVGIPGATVRNVRVTASGAGAVDVVPAEGQYLQDLVVDAGGFLFFYGAHETKFMRRPGAREPVGTVATPNTKTAILDSANNGVRTLVLVRGAHRVGGEYGAAGGDLYLTRLDTMEIAPLVVAPRHQVSPDVASNGNTLLAVWCEYIGSERRLGVIASPLGTEIAIDLHADVVRPTRPRVASNGTDWLVVWVDGSELYGSRVGRGGTTLDAQPFLIAENLWEDSDVAVSWDGTQYVVVYLRGILNRGLHTTPYAARVSPQGTMPHPELVLAEVGPNQMPAIASSPAGSLVVWLGTNLRGALISTSGTFTPLAFPTMNAGSIVYPSVAWNGDTYLVAARQWVLVSATGVIRTPITEFVGPTGPSLGLVEVAPLGDGFALFWQEDHVFSARIDHHGVLTEAPALVDAHAPELARFGTAGNVVVYARKIGHATGEIQRVFWREVVQVNGNPRRRATHSTR